MEASEVLSAVAAFAIAAVLVVGVTAGAGAVLSGGDTTTQQSVSTYDIDSLLPEPVGDDGEIAEPTVEAEKTVVIDASHGNAISRTDVQPLVDVLVGSGHQVQFSSAGSSSGLTGGSSFGNSQSRTPELNRTLRGADAFVIANPASAYSADEVDAIEAFADAGGRVLLLADTPTQGSSATSLLGLSTGTTAAGTGQPNNVASRFGLSFGSSYLYDMTDNANNFEYTYSSSSGDGDVGIGDGETVFHAAVPVTTADDATSVLASQEVNLSSTRKGGTFTTAARSGTVMAVGDTWFLSSEASSVANNEELVGNIASFLVSGSKTPGIPQAPSTPATPTFGSSPPSGPSTPNGSTATPSTNNTTNTTG